MGSGYCCIGSQLSPNLADLCPLVAAGPSHPGGRRGPRGKAAPGCCWTSSYPVRVHKHICSSQTINKCFCIFELWGLLRGNDRTELFRANSFSESHRGTGRSLGWKRGTCTSVSSRNGLDGCCFSCQAWEKEAQSCQTVTSLSAVGCPLQGTLDEPRETCPCQNLCAVSVEKARSLSKQDSLSGEGSSWSLTPAGSLPSSTPRSICFGLSTSVASCWVQLSTVRPSCGSWAGTIVYSGQRLCLSSTYCHHRLL